MEVIENMYHAALIMAHKNIDQVIRLAKSISSEKIDVFIHLDSKMKITEFDIAKIIKCSKNVYVIDKRISGILDTWSLVEITLALIQYAKNIQEKKDIRYKYFILLSGQDYPIKPKDYIENFLEISYPKPFIDVTPYSKENWVYNKFNTISFYKLHHYIDSKMKPNNIRKIFKVPSYSAGKFLSLIKKKKNHFFSYDYNLYGGSAWWILPDVVIDHTINELALNKKKINKLKRTITPEETFFQIMTMNSKVSKLADVNPKDMIEQNCMTYAHFSDIGKPFKGHPYTLEKDDYQMLLNFPQLFARKFDQQIDSEILDLLDENNNI